VTVGSGIVYNQWITAAPVRFALNTQTRVGTGLGAEPTYAVFDLDGGLHRRISDQYLISADISGRFQLASSMTPVFDLPSLGGGESVRGFQTDDALGRKLWSLQSELWAPVPFTLAATQQSGGARWFLRQNVRLAGFFDAGGVWDTNLALSPGLAIPGTSALPGFRKGAGAGIRFIQGPITLKFDWAYGFGHGAFGDGHGRFYIGVSTNGSF
jgi:outer membrane protein assembly factor BamA